MSVHECLRQVCKHEKNDCLLYPSLACFHIAEKAAHHFSSSLSDPSSSGSKSAARNSSSTRLVSGSTLSSIDLLPRRELRRGKDPKIKAPIPRMIPATRRSRRSLRNHLKAMASQYKIPPMKEAFPAIGAPRKPQSVLLGAASFSSGCGEGREEVVMMWKNRE